ncbi:hypothetical protein GH5_02717 [Leishmania sp. Ghana 2012 LV757]|uniref:hypothetical protein n=1 Tax=Leishmania sp. Ghana 2012 LV757 TaxID=2803181 RepID=UPI001B408524|nr:hypothetical protein GH5_02717 [Leishmania sp. Ghana 2012 LV757]
MEPNAVFCRPTGRAATPVFLAVTLCVLALAAPSAAVKASPPSNAVRATPLFERFFAQSFRVSVLTQSFGAFNATLRMRASPNFAERVQGELIPIGRPKLDNRRQTQLPHFERARSLEDDRLSDLPFTVAVGSGRANNKKSGAYESGSRDFALGGEEHPSLLTVDLHLQHSDAMEGVASVFYLPAELKALRAQREGMREGSASPSATVEFAFRSEVEHMTGNPLSDVNDLAYVSSAIVRMDSYSSAPRMSRAAGERVDGSPAVAAIQGGVIFRWITEHEFSAHVMIPILIVDEAGSASIHMERIWVYGYTTPSKSLYDRKQREVPWYNKYMMLGAGLVGFLLQIVSGITEGRKRAQEKAKREAHLREQWRSSKKKK